MSVQPDYKQHDGVLDIQPYEPVQPTDDHLWFDTVNNAWMHYKNGAWVQATSPNQTLLGSYDAATLTDSWSAPNRAKRTGVQVLNTDTNTPLWAHGDQPKDPWGDADGNVVITPV